MLRDYRTSRMTDLIGLGSHFTLERWFSRSTLSSRRARVSIVGSFITFFPQ